MKHLLVLLSFLVAGCGGVATPQSTPAPTRYVIGGANDMKDFFYLVLAPCAERPNGWASAHAVCNLDAVSAVRVSVDEYQRYSQGDPYPAINP